MKGIKTRNINVKLRNLTQNEKEMIKNKVIKNNPETLGQNVGNESFFFNWDSTYIPHRVGGDVMF